MIGTKAAGFTMFELIITIAVVALVVALGIPSFQEIIRNNRMTTTVNAMVSALNMARSEAIKQSQRVVVCPTSDQATCSNDWNDGWMVFSDADGNGALDNPDELVRAFDAPESGNVFTWNGDQPYVLFVPSGEIRLMAGDSGNAHGDFTLTNSVSSESKTINLSPIGRVSRET